MREGCSVALMGLLLDTIPDWGLSLRVGFTTFAVCMVTALGLVQRGIAGATPAVREANNRLPTIPGVPKSSEPARSRADGPLRRDRDRWQHGACGEILGRRFAGVKSPSSR